MRASLLAVAVATVALSGCTRLIDMSGSDWRRADTAIQQVTWDEVECARETETAGDLRDTIVGGLADAVVVPMEDARRGAAFDRCMVARGYAPVEPR